MPTCRQLLILTACVIGFSSKGFAGTTLVIATGELPPYVSDDLTALNRGGLIARSIGKGVLRGIASEYLDMLDTSSAIYEKNGDYAFGIFSSFWCRLMDSASRRLCPTDDNASALASGK